MVPITFKISQAVLLAFHAMAELAKRPEARQTTGDLAARLNLSAAHLAKIMQKLTRAGLLQSTRGPSGGFSLARDPAAIRMQDIYAAIEGDPRADTGPFITRRWGKGDCVFGTMLADVSSAISRYLEGTSLSDAARGYIPATLKTGNA